MMKCENCGNEANFYYSSNINGKKTQRHLCADCARKEGYGEMMDYEPASMFDDMFSDFFRPMRSLFSPFDSFTRGLGSIMAPSLTMPKLHFVIGEPEQKAEETKAAEDAAVDPELKARREREALKQQLDAAVREENFEKAIELRDKLREMDK